MADSDIEQNLEGLAQAASDVAAAAQAAAAESAADATSMSEPPKKQLGRNLEFILDVALQVTVEVGRTRMTIQDLLRLGQGSVVELEKLAGEPLDIFINGKQVARGEAVFG
jgi:flagellar motor switch protein FliN/FliY